MADTWEPVDISGIVSGDYVKPQPTVSARADGPGLFYPGRVHAVGAEPEAGKSWLLILASAQEMARGNHVVYVDFEDDAGGVVSRLMDVVPTTSLTRDAVLELFHYSAPETPLFIKSVMDGELTESSSLGPFLSRIEDWSPTLATFDGMTEALALHGLSSNYDIDIATFQAKVLRPVAARGPAVAVIDHVVKDKETRGRYDKGSGHKLAAVDGASYSLIAVKPFGIGMEGSSDLYIRKDRPGALRKHGTQAAGGLTLYGQLVISGRDDGSLAAISVEPPRTSGETRFKPTGYMRTCSEHAARHFRDGGSPVTLSWFEKQGGKAIYVRPAAQALVELGFLKAEGTSRGYPTYILTRPYLGDDVSPASQFVPERPGTATTNVVPRPALIEGRGKDVDGESRTEISPSINGTTLEDIMNLRTEAGS